MDTDMIYPSSSIDKAKQELYRSRFKSARSRDRCTELAQIYCKDQRKRAQFREVGNIPNLEPPCSNNHYSYEELLWCQYGVRPQIDTHGFISTDAQHQLMKLPNEILFQILENTTVCSATWFGLTCHTIYKLYKTIYPHPIFLDELDNIKVTTYEGTETDFTICLGLLLADWRGIGPRFRLWEPKLTPAFRREDALVSEWHFVPAETFGNILERSVSPYLVVFDKETRLYLRYQDYALMEIDGVSYLPTPCNRAEKEWEREAMDLIVRDRLRHVEQGEWIGFWEPTRIWYGRNMTIMAEEMDLQRDCIIQEMMAKGIFL
jgi:hypothetical protein